MYFFIGARKLQTGNCNKLKLLLWCKTFPDDSALMQSKIWSIETFYFPFCVLSSVSIRWPAVKHSLSPKNEGLQVKVKVTLRRSLRWTEVSPLLTTTFFSSFSSVFCCCFVDLDSFPTLTSPRVRRSLDPSQAFRQLSKKKQFWSDEECQLLKKAVKRFGPGKWSEMRLAYDFNGRTNVNLKDKWRNMVKNGEAWFCMNYYCFFF